MTTQTINHIEFTRINNDVNGNPRHVIHFLELANTYEEACKKAQALHYPKYKGKEYGGMFVVKSYNLQQEALKIMMEVLRDITKGR